MMKWLISYEALQVLIVLAAIASTIWIRRNRLKKNRVSPPPGYVKTEEVTIDPTTGARQQVWFNPQTGERYYEVLSD